jgi:hypothetical protein
MTDIAEHAGGNTVVGQFEPRFKGSSLTVTPIARRSRTLVRDEGGGSAVPHPSG